ncbi:Zinc finger and SCAN domain-containing protein 29 [Varanus komodoensis]|nr:Zinc finger and SCAN domain-containing protein 29 [Varanus komodoensis]
MKPLGEVRRCGLRNHQYTDDTQLYLSFSTNPGEAVAVLNRCLADVMGWMRANKLKLNPDKTEVLLVGGLGFGVGHLDLVLNGVALPLKDRVRSLGVLFDPELSLEAQVTAVARSAFLQLQLIHQLCPYLENDCLATVTYALSFHFVLLVLHSTGDRENYVNGCLEKPIRKENIKEEVTGLVIPEDEDSVNSTPEGTESTRIKQEPIDIDDDSVSTASEDAPELSMGKQITGTDSPISLDEAQNHFRVITINDTGAGKHWCDNEIRALINIWSDEEIQQMLEGATRNKEIFEEIARRLMKAGIDRDWKQCRTKYKNLKYEYRALQKESDQLGNARKKMRFYDEIDCILRSQPPETFTDVITDMVPLRIKRKASEEEPLPVELKKSASENITVQSQRSKSQSMQDTSRTQLNSVFPAVQQVGLFHLFY